MFQVQAEGARAEMVSVNMSHKHHLRPVIRELPLLHNLELMPGQRNILAIRTVKSVDKDALLTGGDHDTFVTQISDLQSRILGNAACPCL